MQLILWRHADAEDGAPDLARELTPKGVKQAARMAEWLEGRLPQGCRILVSPAQRAQQTARALQRGYETADVLAPGADPAAVLAWLRWPTRHEPVLLVGHQPTLGQLAARLVTGRDADWSIRKAAVWWLEQREGRGGVLVRAVIGPDLA